MHSGDAKLKIREESKIKTVVHAEFLSDGLKIFIVEYDVLNEYKNKGYGTMLMYTLMGIARARRLPIILFATEDSIEFYIKLGFHGLRNYKNGKYEGKRVTILNLNNDVDFEHQVGEDDLIWIPPNMDAVVIEI